MKREDLLDAEALRRFESKIDRSGGPDACHPWKAGKNSDGYGYFKYKGYMVQVSRLAWSLAHGGRDPGTRVVRHTCDNPPYSNDRHLKLGTTKQNVADRDRRSRTARGVVHYRSRLTDAAVRDIRASAPTARRAMAAKHKVSLPTVDHVRGRRTWKHVS